MRIAGIYPQRIDIDPKIQHAVSEPYGLEMILAVAKQEGHDVDLFLPIKETEEGMASVGEDEFVDMIDDFEPDVAAFSMYTCQYPMGSRVAAELKRRRPGLVTVAGNRYPTYIKDGVDEPFDFFVVKEGEETFRELLHEMGNGQHYEDVRGLAFRKGGSPVFTGVRGRITDLDVLPRALRFPAILKQVYRGVSLPPLSENPHYAIMEYSRCCYNNCKFCDNEGFWGNRVIFRSPGSVVDEMFELQERGADIFYFMDLNFTAFPDKAMQLCDEMLKRGLRASWYCMSNVSTLDRRDELLHAMKQAGCYKVAYGIESTSDRALEMMNKRSGRGFITSEQTARVLGDSMDAGLLNQGYYIIGFPWETPASILSDARGLMDIPMHQLNIGIFTPIPFSRFHREMLRDGYELDPDLEKHDRNHLVYNHPNMSPELAKVLQERIYADYYAMPVYKDCKDWARKSCSIDPRFRRAFNDYFEFMGKDAMI